MKKLILIFILLLSACQPTPTNPGTEVISESKTEELTNPGPEECQDAISVVVWGDLNIDKIRDPDEPPLSNVLVMLAPQDSPTFANIQHTTGQNGETHFAARELNNCSPLGYDAVFLKQVTGYQFPAEPVVELDNFNPDLDTVEFGLLPESSPEETAHPKDYVGYDIFSQEEITAIMGTLIDPPERFASVGEGVGSFDGCMYISETYFVLIQYGPSPGIAPRDYFDQTIAAAAPESLETISGLGQEAAWVAESERSGNLSILRVDLVLTIYVNGESPLSIAQLIAPIALERIPSPTSATTTGDPILWVLAGARGTDR